jgi:bloom syndrome protein
MTKNNLAVHLKWLKTQGKPSYPQLAQINPPEHDNHVPQQLTPPTDEFAALDDILEDAENETDEAMARLLFAPESASKPRMLSRPDTIPTSTPSTSKKRAEPKQPSVIRGKWSMETNFLVIATKTTRVLIRFFPRTAFIITQSC